MGPSDPGAGPGDQGHAGRGNADHRLGGQTRTAVRGEKAVKRWLGWLLGLVTFRVTGAQPEDFLNLCAQRNLVLWRMVQQDRFTLVVQTTAHQARQLEGLAQGAGFQTEVTGRRGLPFFLWRFRKRYALLAGLVLCLVLFGVGSRTILTVDVTGNQALSAEEIIAQLRLCGVSVGTYAPSIPVREVENRMMLAMDQLTFFSLNLHGTRAEVIVREREEGPDLRPEGRPPTWWRQRTASSPTSRPWAGDAQVHEGDAVCQGDVLISGVMDLDPIPPSTESLGTRIVHAEGKVLARTWRTLTAQIPLTATEKVYTGERTTRYTLSLMGKRVKIFGKSGIPYETYDTITEQAAWTPIPGKTLPLVWEKETYRAYTLESVAVDPDQAEALLRAQLLAALEEQMDQGKVLQTDWEVTEQDGMLEVKLLAQCSEQIGRQAALHLPAQRPEASPGTGGGRSRTPLREGAPSAAEGFASKGARKEIHDRANGKH